MALSQKMGIESVQVYIQEKEYEIKVVQEERGQLALLYDESESVLNFTRSKKENHDTNMTSAENAVLIAQEEFDKAKSSHEVAKEHQEACAKQKEEAEKNFQESSNNHEECVRVGWPVIGVCPKNFVHTHNDLRLKGFKKKDFSLDSWDANLLCTGHPIWPIWSNVTSLYTQAGICSSNFPSKFLKKS